MQYVYYKNEPRATIHDSKYGTTRVLFASTYTAKQMKTLYYSLICLCFILRVFIWDIWRRL